MARARTPGVGWGRWGRRAAGILLGLGFAGAAYATPGSPLRAWMEAAVEWMRSPTAPPPAPDQSVAGIAVAPGRDLVILFSAPQAEGQATVSLSDGAEVVVRGPSGAATFTSDGARLVIDNQGASASFEIQIPRLAPRVEIRLAGERVFLKEGSRITGPFLLPLTSAGP